MCDKGFYKQRVKISAYGLLKVRCEGGDAWSREACTHISCRATINAKRVNFRARDA